MVETDSLGVYDIRHCVDQGDSLEEILRSQPKLTGTKYSHNKPRNFYCLVRNLGSLYDGGSFHCQVFKTELL